MTASWIQRAFLIVLLAIAGVLVFYILAPFLAPLALGIIFAVLLQPLYHSIRSGVGGRETLASLLTVLLCIVIVLIPLSYLGFQLVQEAHNIYANISQNNTQQMQQQFLSRIDPFINQNPYIHARFDQFIANLSVYMQQALSWGFQHAGVAFSSISAFVLQTFIFLITLYYLLRDGVVLKRTIIAYSPLADTDDELIFSELGKSVNSVVKGKLLIALIQGVFCGVGLALFGVPNPVFWGLLAAILSLVPPFGTGLVIFPAVIYLFFSNMVGGAIGLAVWGTIAGLIDNIIGPKLMSSGTQFHPLLMLVSVLGGLAFFGPVGLFLGPIAVSFFITLLSLSRHFLDGASRGAQD